MEIIPSKRNRHTFIMSHDGYRLIFDEWDDKMVPKSYPYCARMSVLSRDENGGYAYFGLGKKQKNDATSFADAIDREMAMLKEEISAVDGEMEKLRRKQDAMRAFLEELPKMMLEDGVDTKDDGYDDYESVL